MFISSLNKAVKTAFTRAPVRYFSITDRDYYNKNLEENLARDTVKQRTVKARGLKRGSHNMVEIYGIPIKALPESENAINANIKDLFAKKEENPVFLQIDPTRYLYSVRHIASKTEDVSAKTEEIQKLLKADPLHPYTWDEVSVHAEVLATYLVKIAKEEEAAAQKGESVEHEATSAEKAISEQEITDYVKHIGVPEKEAETRIHQLIRVVGEHILDNQAVPYYELNNILFYSLFSENQVVLGGMPKIFKRLVLGNSFTLENLQALFKNCCLALQKYKAEKPNISISDVAMLLYPEVFQATEVIYMTVFLKEMARFSKGDFKAIVGIDFVDPIADTWNNEQIEGIRFEDIIGMPQRVESDTVDSLIEKQVILDVLLEEPVWQLPYLKNQFPYLNEEENTDATVVDIRKKFYVLHRKYTDIKEKMEKS